MDMSAEFQSSLNDAGSAKHTAPGATSTTDATADANNENVFNEPEVKRIKLEPNADPAPPAVGIESFECPETKKIKQEPDADPAPPAVGIESFESCPETKKIKQEPGVTSDEKLWVSPAIFNFLLNKFTILFLRCSWHEIYTFFVINVPSKTKQLQSQNGERRKKYWRTIPFFPHIFIFFWLNSSFAELLTAVFRGIVCKLLFEPGWEQLSSVEKAIHSCPSPTSCLKKKRNFKLSRPP